MQLQQWHHGSAGGALGIDRLHGFLRQQEDVAGFTRTDRLASQQARAGLQAGGGIGGPNVLGLVDPAQPFEVRVLDHQGLCAYPEFLGIEIAIRNVTRDPHQLLLALEQPQPQALLRVFDITPHGLVFAVNLFEPQIGECHDDGCEEQHHGQQRRQYRVPVLAPGIELPPPVADTFSGGAVGRFAAGGFKRHARSVWDGGKVDTNWRMVLTGSECSNFIM